MSLAPVRCRIREGSLLGDAVAACGDERADAKQDEDEANSSHEGLHARRVRTCDDVAGPHTNDTDDAWEGAEEAEQTDGDSNVHEEHAALCVGRVGQRAKDGEEKAEESWDERVWVMAHDEVGACAKQDKQNAECDSEFCHLREPFGSTSLFPSTVSNKDTRRCRANGRLAEMGETKLPGAGASG